VIDVSSKWLKMFKQCHAMRDIEICDDKLNFEEQASKMSRLNLNNFSRKRKFNTSNCTALMRAVLELLNVTNTCI